MTTLAHIIGAVATPTPIAVGLGWWAYMAIAAFLALAAALIYGMLMSSSRDRRLDPAAETTTARLYER
jgi:ABC-type antimicrobial peptide transport system permease subunit